MKDKEDRKPPGVEAMFNPELATPAKEEHERNNAPDERIRRTYVLPASLAKALDRCAADRGKEKSDVVACALQEYLARKYF